MRGILRPVYVKSFGFELTVLAWSFGGVMNVFDREGWVLVQMIDELVLMQSYNYWSFALERRKRGTSWRDASRVKETGSPNGLMYRGHPVISMQLTLSGIMET